MVQWQQTDANITRLKEALFGNDHLYGWVRWPTSHVCRVYQGSEESLGDALRRYRACYKIHMNHQNRGTIRRSH